MKSELGTKRTCPSCGAKFYDLKKNPVTCPKCSHGFSPQADVKPKRAKPAATPESKPVKAATAEIVEDTRTVSLDAMRDDEAEADTDADDDVDAEILGLEDESLDDVDDDDDTFLENDEEDEDDVTGLVRGVGGEKEA